MTAIGDQAWAEPRGVPRRSRADVPDGDRRRRGHVGERIGVDGFPTLYFVASDGTVARYASGELSEEQIKETVRRAFLSGDRSPRVAAPRDRGTRPEIQPETRYPEFQLFEA